MLTATPDFEDCSKLNIAYPKRILNGPKNSMVVGMPVCSAISPWCQQNYRPWEAMLHDQLLSVCDTVEQNLVRGWQSQRQEGLISTNLAVWPFKRVNRDLTKCCTRSSPHACQLTWAAGGKTPGEGRGWSQEMVEDLPSQGCVEAVLIY